MTRHLSFVAALGVCLCALHVTCHGQEVKTVRETAVARDGDSSPIMGVPHEKVEELVRGAKLLRERLTTQQPENIALLRKQLRTTFPSISWSSSLSRSQSASKHCRKRNQLCPATILRPPVWKPKRGRL